MLPRRVIAVAAVVWLWRGDTSHAPAPARGLPPRPDAPAFDPVNELARIAAAHRAWVADHGPGCAPSTEALLPYLGLDRAKLDDLWGTPVALACGLHVDSQHRIGPLITVSVISAGPDRIVGNDDDLIGVDRQNLHPAQRYIYCSYLCTPYPESEVQQRRVRSWWRWDHTTDAYGFETWWVRRT